MAWQARKTNAIVSSGKTGGLAWSVTVTSLSGGRDQGWLCGIRIGGNPPEPRAYTHTHMLRVLEDLVGTRTDNDRDGTLASPWDEVLLWRDLCRLAEDGLVEAIDGLSRPNFDSLERRHFRDVGTGYVYVYFPGGEKRSPQFRRGT